MEGYIKVQENFTKNKDKETKIRIEEAHPDMSTRLTPQCPHHIQERTKHGIRVPRHS